MGHMAGETANLAEVDTSTASAVPRYASPEAVFRVCYVPLVRALSALAGPVEAEDAVQEAFVQLYARWGRVQDYDNPAAWVRRVALRRLADRKRSLARRAAALLRLEPPEPSASPCRSEYLDICAALRRLPSRQRLAIALFYLADLSIREVAETMKISEGAVNRHLHDGRGALRGFLGD
jgi:RNA polymerase sigma-70 factor, ECF subfamily